jgi:hypothetical protein
MISKKAIFAGIFSVLVGIGMLVMPTGAMAHDRDHDGGGWGHRHHDNGRHLGWNKHRGDDDDYRGGGYYQQPNNYGYQQPYRYGRGDNDGDEGYRYGNGRRSNGWNGNGMVSRRHPGLIWACDSQGHHCHWARRYGSNYRYNGYYGNNGYGNGYYGNNGYYGSPLGGLGALVGPLLGGPVR